MAGRSSAPTGPGGPRAEIPSPQAARRFAGIVCPPQIKDNHRAERVMHEFALMLGSLPPAARKALAATLAAVDQGARLYPPARGRRFTRLEDRTAAAYVRALLARPDPAAELVRRLKSVLVMCYYELPEVQREIGYEPEPFIAAVTRRRLERYGPEIRAHETTRHDGP